jgi:osmotically inducible protein OsmC
MPTRNASATWNGDLKSGKGDFKLGSGGISAQYSFGTRFENAPGTNPEELIAGAHAACFSMALSAGLGKNGFNPQRVTTTAQVTIDKVEAGFKITRIKLISEAVVPNIDNAKFQEIANATKTGCPVSGALSAVPIELEAKLANG